MAWQDYSSLKSSSNVSGTQALQLIDELSHVGADPMRRSDDAHGGVSEKGALFLYSLLCGHKKIKIGSMDNARTLGMIGMRALWKPDDPNHPEGRAAH